MELSNFPPTTHSSSSAITKIDRLKGFAAEYGARFMTPTYEFGSRENRWRMLKEFGRDIDYLSLRGTRMI
jgi:hypothetical protein